MTILHILAERSSSPASFDKSGSERQLTKNGRGLAVLIVDDDPAIGEYLTEVVEEFGAKVIGVAAEPADAFGLVVEHRPDIVIMDIRLKDGHDGLHAADAMRLLYRTPIVFCTGYGDAETLSRIERFGGSECLLKPIRPEPLRDAILRACGL
jgi:CheY-like chemotaxis protein